MSDVNRTNPESPARWWEYPALVFALVMWAIAPCRVYPGDDYDD